MTAYLYPSKELGLAETHFELKKRTTTVGRHPNNDISLLLESVSRFHARIESRENGWALIDLNSSNGTFLNGERIATPRTIANNDVITFGRADFVFSLLAPEERGSETGRVDRTQPSSVNIVGEDHRSSTILSTQLNVESTPLPGTAYAEAELDVEALHKANERLLTLYKLSEVIRASISREDVLASFMNLIFEVLPADRGVIMTLDSEAKLEPQIVRFRQGNKNELTISRTIVQKCLTERVAVLSRDAKIDSRFSASESIVASDIRSAICVPLISNKSIIGILFIDTKESVRAFNEDDLAFLTSMANDLAITIDNISLAEENIKNERLAAVGQTIAGLAHNIKNILQLAKGGIELMDLSIKRKSFEEVEAYWPVVRRGIDRMQSLTQEMLDYSRQNRPELVEGDVNYVIEDTVKSFQKEHVDPGVDIQVQLGEGVPKRKIDPDGLFKSLLNLVSNAVDAFDGAGGSILISTSFEHNTIYIRVADNGKGIPKDKRQKIFQPFFTTKGSKGTGLGLSMTRKYIEDMGGTISVESEEGQGTAFTIALPPLTVQIGFDLEEPSPNNTNG